MKKIHTEHRDCADYHIRLPLQDDRWIEKAKKTSELGALGRREVIVFCVYRVGGNFRVHYRSGGARPTYSLSLGAFLRHFEYYSGAR